MMCMLVVAIARCGGDGGGAPAGLIYTGNTDAAVISLKNATTLVANVLYAGESSTNLPVSARISGNTSHTGDILLQSKVIDELFGVIRDSIYGDDVSGPEAALGIVVNEPLACDSGSGYVSGTLSDIDGTGTLTFTFSNCVIEGITYNGTGNYIVDYFDFGYLLPTDVRIIFTLMTINGLGFNGSTSGNIRYQIDISSNTESMALNYVAMDNVTGKMYKYENVIVTTVYDNYYSPSTKTVAFTGAPARAYDSVYGYVEIDTSTPLKYSYVALAQPDMDGVVIFTGAAGASIRVTVLSTDDLQLELDIDGVSGYEESRVLSWDDLVLDVENDLTGTDSVYVLRIPSSGDSLTGVGAGSYFGQTFKLYEDVSAERLTVYFAHGVVDFRVLLVETVSTPEFHPTTVLFESNTISVTEPNTAVTVSFGGLGLNAGQTYAWILDGYVENNGYSMIYVDDYFQDTYPDGFLFTANFISGTREEHFDDGFWYPGTDDMALVFEYKRK